MQLSSTSTPPATDHPTVQPNNYTIWSSTAGKLVRKNLAFLALKKPKNAERNPNVRFLSFLCVVQLITQIKFNFIFQS